MRASHQLGGVTCGNEPVALRAVPGAGAGTRKPGNFSAGTFGASRPRAHGGRFLPTLAGALGLRPLSGALAFAGALSLGACDARPIESARTGNPDVDAALIARIEGCNLYRVRDGANRSVYVAICPEGATRSSWSEGCGKGCTRDAGSLVVRARQGRD